jgi:hypothetical protein
MTTAPMNPLAGASGPGPYAVRTDKLDMGSTSYGEGKETAEIKSAEPLAKTESVRATPVAEVRAAAAKSLPKLFDESGRPQEDIMVGTDAGPGEGSSALGMAKIQVKLSDSLAAMLPFDTTGEIAVLYQEALAQGN